MLSFFYEGDITRLGGGVLIEKRIKKTPISSDFLADLYLDKKYPAKIHFPIYGGYEVRDILSDKDEALDYVMGHMKSERRFLLPFCLRWLLKFVLHIMCIAMPVFLVLMFRSLDVPHRVFGVCFTVICEAVLFIINGVLNRL